MIKIFPRKAFKSKINIKSNVLSDHLRSLGKVDDNIELAISRLSLEELIQLKLEITERSLKKHKFIGFPLYKIIIKSSKDALVNYVVSKTTNLTTISKLLGIGYKKTKAILKDRVLR